MSKERLTKQDGTTEFSHVWKAIAEIREALYDLSDKVGIEAPEWHEPIPYDLEE